MAAKKIVLQLQFVFELIYSRLSLIPADRTAASLTGSPPPRGRCPASRRRRSHWWRRSGSWPPAGCGRILPVPHARCKTLIIMRIRRLRHNKRKFTGKPKIIPGFNHLYTTLKPKSGVPCFVMAIPAKIIRPIISMSITLYLLYYKTSFL